MLELVVVEDPVVVLVMVMAELDINLEAVDHLMGMVVMAVYGEVEEVQLHGAMIVLVVEMVVCMVVEQAVQEVMLQDMEDGTVVEVVEEYDILMEIIM